MTARAWESAADDVLSVLVTEQYVTDADNYFNAAWHERGLALHHMPAGRQRALLDAVLMLHDAGRGVNWNNVADVGNAAITEQWFAEIVTLADPTRMGRTFYENLDICREHGETARVVEALEETSGNLKRGGKRDVEVDLLITTLSQDAARPMRDTSATGGAARLEALLQEAQRPTVATGIDWLDGATRGLLPAQLWYLSGPYKSSKTRIGYNVALAAAEQDTPVAILSRENQEPVIAAQIVSMYAARYLLDKGVPYDPTQRVWWISPTGLLQARREYRNWQPAVRVEAVRHGLKQYAALANRLHIFDATPDGGALSDITSIRRAIQRHKRLHGARTDGTLCGVYVVDHLGLIKRDGTVYEKTAATSNDFQSLSREDSAHPITLLILAQQSESVVNAGDDAYGSNVKGAGEPSADADVLLTTKPVKVAGDYANDRTRLTVKLNRFGPSGGKRDVVFHPDSGLILPEHLAEIVRGAA